MRQGWHTTGWPDDATAPTIATAAPTRRPFFTRLNRFAIAIVLVNVVSIALLAVKFYAGWPISLVFMAAVVSLVLLDARELRRAGHGVTAWWQVLATIAYLIHRTNRARQTVAIPVAYALTSVVVWVLALGAVTELIAEEERRLEDEAGKIHLIEAELEQELPHADGAVTCDLARWHLFGYTTTDCTFTTDERHGWVEVTVHDDGSWTWVEHEGTPVSNP